MNRIILIILGVAILAVIFVVVVLNKNGSGSLTQNLQNSVKKEISVGTDVCAQFPKEWAATAFGKPIIKTSSLDTTGTHSCQYYTDENNFIILRLNSLSVENQKKGQTSLGRTLTSNPKIKMEHFIVIEKDGLINGIYLIINPNLFITVDRNSVKAASQDEILNFAVKVSQRIQAGENIVAYKSTTQTPIPKAQVPLLQGEDIVRNLFNLIGEGRVSDALNLLSPSAIQSDSAKQAWGVQFNAFKKISVKKIEPSGENTYKVTLDVEMKPGTENANPMPYYGWGNGEFVRWVLIEKVDNTWKVVGISTGP